MHNLVPDFILEKLKQKKSHGEIRSSVLFVDIRGFTRMTETLMKESNKGSEILSSIINEIFSELVSSIHRHNGFVATFAGDAFTAVFPKDKGTRAIAAAVEIVNQTVKNPVKKTLHGDFEIAVRVGISEGFVSWGIIDADETKTYYFRGEAIDRAAEAEAKAEPNEIVLSEEAAESVDEKLFSRSENKIKLTGLNPSDCSVPSVPMKPEKDLINEFFNTQLMPQTSAGEFRDAVSLFVSFKGRYEHESLNNLMKKIISLTDGYKGYFNMIDFGDKGSKVVIVFGAPVSYEKMLERSIECAKSIVEIDKENIKAGITFGRVFAGYVGSSDRCTYTVLGDKVNLSARIMSAAKTGEVWTEESVAEEMKWKFDFTDMGEMQFKGKSERERIFKVQSKKNLSREDSLFENEIVGRENEIKKIQDIVEVKLFNHKFGGFVNIFGEAGVGKSRLMFEVMQRNIESCESMLLKNDDIYNRSLYPFEVFFKRFFNQINSDTLKERKNEFEISWKNALEGIPHKEKEVNEQDIQYTKEIFKGFLKISEPDSVWESMDSKLRLENTLFAFKHLFKILSLKKPLLICVEDIQWQDNDSNEFFKVLSRKAENYPILIITTSRYSDDGEKILLPVENGCDVENITVGSLSLEDSKDYISKQLIFSPSNALIGKIFEKTDGNPFYIEQISLYLIENDILEIKNDEYSLKKDIEEIPHGINAIIIARIDRLTRELKEIVQNAAVLGREFEVEILSRMLSGKVNEKSLDEGINEKIWLPLNQVKYIFKHNMMRDAAYNMQLKNKLRELHLIAGETLEKIHGSDKHKYADIAYHFERGDSFDKAQSYYKTAGFDAKQDFKNYDAEKYLLSALKYTKDKSEKIEIRLMLGEAYYQMGEWEKTKTLYDSLIDDMSENDDELLKGRIFIANSELLFEKGNIEESKKSLDRAEEIFVRLNEKKWSTKALMARAQILWRQGNLEESEKIYREALEKATALDEKKLIAETYLTLGNIYKDRCVFDKAMEYYEKTKKLSTENNLKTGLCGVIGNMGLIEWMKGDYQNAMVYFNEEMEIAKTIGSKFIMSYIYGNMGSVYFHMNEFDKAEEHYLKQIAIAEELGEKKNIRIALNNLGGVCEMKGEYEKELDYFEKSLKIAEELNAKMGIRIVLSNIGNVYGKWGEHEKSLKYFMRSLKIAEELDDKRGIAILKLNIASSYSLKNDLENGEKNVDEALDIMKQYSLKPNMPKAMLERASILFRMKRYDESLAQADEGIQVVSNGDYIHEQNEKTQLRVLRLRIIALKEKNRAIEELKDLLKDLSDPLDIGEVQHALYDLTGEEESKHQAMKGYENYYSSHPIHAVKMKIKELGG
ncbi:MAG: tetratricopeptide repeat protein [bacterium]|nr:tetratricopeptide repeat protein [bacterium]